MISGKPLTRSAPASNILGQVYRCPVCGAELSVIRGGAGQSKPICCNVEMVLTGRINSMYVCPVCFSELMVIRGNDKNLEPVCCNKRMIKKS